MKSSEQKNHLEFGGAFSIYDNIHAMFSLGLAIKKNRTPENLYKKTQSNKTATDGAKR